MPSSGLRGVVARGFVVGAVFGACLPLPHLLFAGVSITAPFGGLATIGDGLARFAALVVGAATVAVAAGATSAVEGVGRRQEGAGHLVPAAASGAIFAAGLLAAALEAAFAYESVLRASPGAGYIAALGFARRLGPTTLAAILAPSWLPVATVTLARLERSTVGQQMLYAFAATLVALPLGALVILADQPRPPGDILPPPGFGVAVLIALVLPALLRGADEIERR